SLSSSPTIDLIDEMQCGLVDTRFKTNSNRSQTRIPLDQEVVGGLIFWGDSFFHGVTFLFVGSRLSGVDCPCCSQAQDLPTGLTFITCDHASISVSNASTFSGS